jgi:queuine tRNA-ribosyltransferase
MNFKIQRADPTCKARCAEFRTEHGLVQTPIFMPVGTIGTVKTLSPQDLIEQGSQIILSNTYHLYLKPGMKVLREFNGLHGFVNWRGPLLTDSGGFQVYSLNQLRTINSEGVEFKSHWDGSTHFFTPEKVVDIQRTIGSDIMMVLDQCIPNPSDFTSAESANELTLKWAEQSRKHLFSSKPHYGFQQFQFGIVQGGIYPELRKSSAEGLLALDFDGYAIGGLAVGESMDDRWQITDFCTDLLPEERPRYLMGVGKPDDILNAIELGIDMFDCVIPTRNARNGSLFTSGGVINIRNAQFINDKNPVESDCFCFACQNFTRAYLRHMFNVNEILGLRLATIHNVHFYLSLVRDARQAILENRFGNFKNGFLEKFITSREREEAI